MDDGRFVAALRSQTRRRLLAPDYYRPLPQAGASKAREALAAVLGRRPGRERYAFFWTTAILAWGLARSHHAFGEAADREALEAFFASRLAGGSLRGRLRTLDDAMHGDPLLHLRGAVGDGRYDPALHETAEFLLKTLPRTPLGALPYRQNQNDLLFVDAVGMIAPFLARYGMEFSQPEATSAAVRQMAGFLRTGLDPATGLPYHAYRESDGERLGLSGWGRGTGWLLVGLTDSLEHIPAGHPDRPELVAGLQKVLSAAARRQGVTGAFAWRLSEPDARHDSSATAMIGYALARAAALGLWLPESGERARRCLAALRAETAEDGIVSGGSGECGGLGSYSREFGAYPWVQGPTLALAAAVAELGPGEQPPA
ncbi:MAG: unsaturated glucuronyl hydrolase [Elusimicrobia bacterium]|nr:MAG: unsaturated glucuronyl hydrolase [Elusimicrobiota bacterium]